MIEHRLKEEVKDLFLFQLFTLEELPDVVCAFKEKNYSAGERIFTEKDRGETMYVVKTGSVRITVKESTGKDKELIIMSSGDFFGEITLFEYALRTATAVTIEESSILEISRNEFNALFSQKPHLVAKLLYQMMTEMSRRLRRKNANGAGIIL